MLVEADERRCSRCLRGRRRSNGHQHLTGRRPAIMPAQHHIVTWHHLVT